MKRQALGGATLNGRRFCCIHNNYCQWRGVDETAQWVVLPPLYTRCHTSRHRWFTCRFYTVLLIIMRRSTQGRGLRRADRRAA